MNNLIIFLAEFTLSLLTYGLLARFVWWDRLENPTKGKGTALLLVPHTFRHLGLLALVPQVVGKAVTRTPFAAMLGYGDGGGRAAGSTDDVALVCG